MDTIIGVIREMVYQAMEQFEEGSGDDGIQTLKDLVDYIDERFPDCADPHAHELKMDALTRTIHPRAYLDTYDGVFASDDTDESEWSHR